MGVVKFGVCVGVILFAGLRTTVAAAATPIPSPSPYAYAEPSVLVAKAKAMGEAEIARLAAAEMVYRDKVYYHLFDTGFSTSPNRTCLKLYRRFTGFEVKDIERAPSVLRPLKITIRFDFDRIGTREVKTDTRDANVERQVQADHAFVIHDSQSVVREYFCSAQGDPIELPPPYLERTIIYLKPGALVNHGDAWIEDPEISVDVDQRRGL